MKKIFIFLSALIFACFGIGCSFYCPTNKATKHTFSICEEIEKQYTTEINFEVYPIYLNNFDGVYGEYSVAIMDNIVQLLNTTPFMGKLKAEIGRQTDNEEKIYEEDLSVYGAAFLFSFIHNEGIEKAPSRIIRANISVKKDIQFAEILVRALETVAPIFVEENMPLVGGTSGAKCQRSASDKMGYVTINSRFSCACGYATVKSERQNADF